MFSSLLTTVSGVFSRSLILGTFLPTLIFTLLVVLFAGQLVPPNFDLTVSLNIFGGEWKLLSLTIIAIVLSGVLYNLNSSLIRLYEGYPWKKTWPGKWLTKRQTKKFRELDAKVKGTRTLLRAMTGADSDLQKKAGDKIEEYKIKGRWFEKKLGIEEFLKDSARVEPLTPKERWDLWKSNVSKEWNVSLRKLLVEFPAEETLVLPTRLGNVIRSFENYPFREYKMDPIALYPRLIATIDKEYAVIIDEAKTSFDFMINLSFLGGVSSFLLLITGIWFARPFIDSDRMTIWLTGIGLCAAIAVFAYYGAVSRAWAWGENVKSAFDLYRNPLLSQLGFSEAPKTREEEREMWSNISRQMIYGDHPVLGPRFTSYSEPQTMVSGNPGGVALTVLRGVESLDEKNGYQVFIVVTNRDSSEVTAKNVVIVDSLPEGHAFRPHSAVFRNKHDSLLASTVEGTNPYKFSIGDLKFNDKTTLTYDVVSTVIEK